MARSTMMAKAIYHTHLDLNLNNNPLSEAIQIELNRENLINNLTNLPNIQKNFWNLPELYQQTQLRQLTEIHIPVPQTWNLYNKILSLVLFGYVRRNPLSKEMRIQHARIAESMRLRKIYNPGPMLGIGPTTAPASLVFGDSGSGKTKAIRSILGEIEQVKSHQSYKGGHFKKEQLVWISFDLPPNGSPKAMAANFFRAVDNALGTSYANEWSDHRKFSVDGLMSAMQHVASTHYLGIVHIDELQFMIGYKKIKDSPSLQTLETLFNKIGVPIIQSCTQQGIEIFESLKDGDHRLGHDMTTVRRMLNDREFKFSTHNYDSPFFNELFNALFPPGLIYGSQSDITSFRQTFHRLSCGLPAIMIRLAHMHHETFMILQNKVNHTNKNDRTYDLELLNRVFKNQFNLIAPALVQLRSGNSGAYENSICNAKTKRATFSNNEVKTENKKSKSEVKNPTVVKTDSTSSLEPLTGQGLSLDNFKVGIEVDHGKS